MYNKKIRLFLRVAGGFLALTTGQPIVSALMHHEYDGIVIFVVLCCVGIFLFCAGSFWYPKPEADGRLVSTLAILASDSRAYAAMILLAWLYMATTSAMDGIRRNNEIIAVRNDQQSIAEVLDRFVLPRQLSREQISMMGTFLQQFPAQNYSFAVAQGDEEANQFRSNIQEALTKGGWHMKANGVDYVVDPPDSLSLIYRQAKDTVQVEDQRMRPDKILQMAFGLAGIPVGAGGSGVDTSIKEDEFKIAIGHRRRDAYSLPCTPN